MHPAARRAVVHRIAQVQHFVKHDVLQSHRRSGRPRLVEDAADNDGVMRRVEVPQHAAGWPAAPSQLRPAQQAIEELPVQTLEDILQVVVRALRP